MLAVNYSEFEKNLEKYCDQAAEEYVNVFVTREDNKNIVIMSFEEYADLINKVKEK